MAIVFIRTIIVFVSITVALRLMGKRQMGELELSELVVAILISDLAANPLEDIGIPLLNGLIPVVVLLCCELIISGLIVKNLKFRALICGKPSILIANGVIDQKELLKNRFTIDELTEELRTQAVTDISKVKFAVLETGGILNIMLYPAEQPLTPSQMGISVPDTGYATIIINDGRIVDENLARVGRDRKWLLQEIKIRGITKPENVFIFTVNDAGQIYYLPKEEKK